MGGFGGERRVNRNPRSVTNIGRFAESRGNRCNHVRNQKLRNILDVDIGILANRLVRKEGKSNSAVWDDD